MTKRQIDPSVKLDLPVRIWGMAQGHAFFQDVHTEEVNHLGAKLLGIAHPLTPGEVIGVQFGEIKTRVKLMWVIDAGETHKITAGVEILEGQVCPWQGELEKLQKPEPASQAPAPPQDVRRFPRHKVPFPIEIREQRSNVHMKTQATDISGRGCYVETMLPLQKETALTITFWVDSEKITTPAVVRTCDGGVGMGIEFVGLADDDAKRLQVAIEKMRSKEDPASSARGAP